MATLQELDHWGNLEALDVYGNLDYLDNVSIKTSDGSASTAVTTASLIEKLRTFTATSSVVVTVSIDRFGRIRPQDGEAIGAASVAAQCAFIAHMTASGALVVTSTAQPQRLQHYTASVDVLATSTADAFRLQHDSGAVDVSISATSGTSVIFVIVGASTFDVAVEAIGEILGEKWSFVDEGAETWTDYSIVSDTWTNSVTGSETWTDAELGSEVWTDTTDGTEIWYRQ